MVLKLLAKGLGVALSIVLARILGPEDLGLVQLANNYALLFALIGIYGFRLLIVQSLNKNYENISLFRSAISFTFTLIIFLTIAGFFILLSYSEILGFPSFDYVYFVLTIALASHALKIFAYILLGIRKIAQSIFVEEVAVNFLSLIFMIFGYLIIPTELNTVTILWFNLLSRLVILICLLFYNPLKNVLRKWDGFGVNKEHVFQATPLFIVAIVGIFQARLDTAILGGVASSEDIAFWSVAIALTQFVPFAQQLYESYYTPKLTVEKIRDLGFQNELRWSTRLILFIAVLMTLFYSLAGSRILAIWGEEFSKGALYILVFLSFSQIMNSLSGISGLVLIMAGHRALRRNISLISGVIQVLLSSIFVPSYGLIGAGISVFVTSSIVNISLLILVKQRLRFSML